MVEFSAQQHRALKRLLARPPANMKNNFSEDFLLKYVFVESLCRLVGKYYQERPRVKKKSVSQSHQTIQINVVSRSLAYFGIQLRPEQLANFLDSSFEKRDEKSARNLRNGIVHRWDENDVGEASRRYSSLCLTLNAVVKAIANRVNGGMR